MEVVPSSDCLPVILNQEGATLPGTPEKGTGAFWIVTETWGHDRMEWAGTDQGAKSTVKSETVLAAEDCPVCFLMGHWQFTHSLE